MNNMFDEQKEPEDIFAGTEPDNASTAAIPDPAASQVSGVQPVVAEPSPSRAPSKLLFILIVIIVLGLIGGGVWYFFLRNSVAETAEPLVTEEPAENGGAMTTPETSGSVCGDGFCELGEESICPQDCVEPAELLCGNGICDSEETAQDCPIDCPPLPSDPVIEPEPANQPLDTDGDGLSDDDEREHGTNPQEADTDADGLSDREEVVLYQTNPTNPDTDGDGFIDGDEVKAGYNPNGEGRLLNIPQ